MAQKLTKEVEKALRENDWYLSLKEIDGKIIGIQRFAFTIAIVYDISTCGDYEHRFCYPYEFTKDCLMAFDVWDGIGDPPGRWLKNKGYGVERSNPLNPDPFEEKLKAIEAERDKLNNQ